MRLLGAPAGGILVASGGLVVVMLARRSHLRGDRRGAAARRTPALPAAAGRPRPLARHVHRRPALPAEPRDREALRGRPDRPQRLRDAGDRARRRPAGERLGLGRALARHRRRRASRPVRSSAAWSRSGGSRRTAPPPASGCSSSRALAIAARRARLAPTLVLSMAVLGFTAGCGVGVAERGLPAGHRPLTPGPGLVGHQPGRHDPDAALGAGARARWPAPRACSPRPFVFGLSMSALCLWFATARDGDRRPSGEVEAIPSVAGVDLEHHPTVGAAVCVEDRGRAPEDLGVPVLGGAHPQPAHRACPATTRATARRRRRARRTVARPVRTSSRADVRSGLDTLVGPVDLGHRVAEERPSVVLVVEVVERPPGAAPRAGRSPRPTRPPVASRPRHRGQRPVGLPQEEDHERRGDHVVRRRRRSRVGGVALGDVHVGGRVRGVLAQSAAPCRAPGRARRRDRSGRRPRRAGRSPRRDPTPRSSSPSRPAATRNRSTSPRAIAEKNGTPVWS